MRKPQLAEEKKVEKRNSYKVREINRGYMISKNLFLDRKQGQESKTSISDFRGGGRNHEAGALHRDMKGLRLKSHKHGDLIRKPEGTATGAGASGRFLGERKSKRALDFQMCTKKGREKFSYASSKLRRGKREPGVNSGSENSNQRITS